MAQVAGLAGEQNCHQGSSLTRSYWIMAPPGPAQMLGCRSAMLVICKSGGNPYM